VLGSGESRWVFVPEGDHAARREVRVRELDARRLEIVEGLKPGDQVLVGSDLSRLEPGVPIRIEGSVADR
jgi:multidrug efflux pump subunit AcrA (membrane-fusion protein)